MPSSLVTRVAGAALAAGLALAVFSAPIAAQELPPAPRPAHVTLDPGNTALVVLDVTSQTCAPQPNCIEMVPRIAALLARARDAGVYVVYSTPATVPPILPEVAPADGDPSVAGLAQDRFDTPLDELLRNAAVTLSRTDLIDFQAGG